MRESEARRSSVARPPPLIPNPKFQIPNPKSFLHYLIEPYAFTCSSITERSPAITMVA
jgi:hypothetical protein